MSDTPKDDDKLPDEEAEARFKAIVGNLVNTPHKPHRNSAKKKSAGSLSKRVRDD